MWWTVISQLSAVRWHFSQLDGFLCLTSVSKGSAAHHSQCLPLDRDANRALTDPVPPSLSLSLTPLNSSPSKQDQTLRSCCSCELANICARADTHEHRCTWSHLYKCTHHHHPSQCDKTNYASHTHFLHIWYHPPLHVT